MKSFLTGLTTIFLTGAMILGFGAVADAQRDSQQPEEIPPQYSSQAQYPPAPGQYPQNQGQPQQAPNDAGAARISFIHGDLSTQHSDSSEWVAATLNTPVVNGDRISTGKRSRAEIQLDYANVLRMSDESTANVVNLSRNQIQLQVGQGLVNLDVLKNSDANVEIDTPNVAIRPQTNEGSYRIAVNSDGETIVDVREGSAEISTPQGSTRVDRDQRITIQGNADNAQYNVSAALRKDDWDRWNEDRDHVIERAASWRHTDPYYTGTHDLDDYGHWRDVPDYGSVWFPNDGPDWAPYRDGRWVFEPYYGWTWVSYEPWGWAPYHYGRWFVYGGSWGWWPGPVYGGYRPIWAPAYVSFFGFGGGGWSVGFGFGGGFGSIGWLPCGPGDRFYPWYGRGGDRINVVNIYNIHNDREHGFAPLREGPRGYSNVDRAFSDPHVRSGISSMGSRDFGRGSVPTHQQRFDEGSLRQASVITSGHPVTPSRESFRPSDRPVSPGAVPSRASTNQRFYSSNARTGRTVETPGAQGGFNRGGNGAVNQPQQNAGRPGFGNFGPNNSGNANPGNRQGSPNSGNNLPQQNADRSGPRNFGPGGGGNMNRGQTPEQANRPSESTPGSRGFVPPASQQSQSNSSARPGWRTFTPPSSAQPEAGGRNYGGQRPEQSRPNYSQPSESQRQYPSNSRGNSGSGGSGYSRPPLNMQQPVVTPRGGTYSYPRSSPNSGGYNSGSGGAPRGGSQGGGYDGGGYRNAPPSGGGYRNAPPSGGGYRNAPPSDGGYRSAPPSGGGYRSAPPSGGYGGGGSRGGSSGGGNRGGSSGGGGSRGGSSGGRSSSSSGSGSAHSQSGHNGR